MDIGPYLRLALVLFSVSIALFLHKLRDKNTFIDNRKGQIRDVLSKTISNAVDYYLLIQHIGKFDLPTAFLKERLRPLHPYFEYSIDEIINLRRRYNSLYKTGYVGLLLIGFVCLPLMFIDIFTKPEIAGGSDFILRLIVASILVAGFILLLFIMGHTSLYGGNYTDEDKITNYMDLLLEKDYSGTFKDRFAIINSPNSEKKQSYISRYSSIINCLNTILPSLENPKLLDIGCGDGVLEKEYVADGINVLGIDVSKESIEQAHINKKASHRFQRISLSDFVKETRTENDKFDVIILCDILEHFVAPEMRLRELKSILKKNGHVLATLPNIGSSYNLNIANKKPLLDTCLPISNKCCHLWADIASNKTFPHFLYSEDEARRIFRKSFLACELAVSKFGESDQGLFVHAVITEF